jgi:Flp pilus assembly protein TadD
MSHRLLWILLVFFAMERAIAEVPVASFDNASAMYSHGVHGYFSGNLTRAEMYLQRATDLDPNDPRTYYFHGLTLLRLGRTWEAEAVLQQGASVEASSNASAYNIGEALQRVQARIDCG